MDKRFIRDNLRMLGAVCFFWLYIPHVIVYLWGGKKTLIDSDIDAISYQLNIRIPRLIRLAEAPSHGKPILEYEPRSRGTLAYYNLAKEVIERNE